MDLNVLLNSVFGPGNITICSSYPVQILCFDLAILQFVRVIRFKYCVFTWQSYNLFVLSGSNTVFGPGNLTICSGYPV